MSDEQVKPKTWWRIPLWCYNSKLSSKMCCVSEFFHLTRCEKEVRLRLLSVLSYFQHLAAIMLPNFELSRVYWSASPAFILHIMSKYAFPHQKRQRNSKFCGLWSLFIYLFDTAPLHLFQYNISFMGSIGMISIGGVVCIIQALFLNNETSNSVSPAEALDPQVRFSCSCQGQTLSTKKGDGCLLVSFSRDMIHLH